MFVGLVWLTTNHMFGSGDFGDKLPSQNVITSTNWIYVVEICF